MSFPSEFYVLLLHWVSIFIVHVNGWRAAQSMPVQLCSSGAFGHCVTPLVGNDLHKSSICSILRTKYTNTKYKIHNHKIQNATGWLLLLGLTCTTVPSVHCFNNLILCFLFRVHCPFYINCSRNVSRFLCSANKSLFWFLCSRLNEITASLYLTGPQK